MRQFSRRSSDAPEVVPGEAFVLSPTTTYEHLFKSPTWSFEAAHTKPGYGYGSPKSPVAQRGEFRRSESLGREQFRRFTVDTELERRQRHTQNLVITICLVVLAFLAGGGIGGGIGGAVAAQRSRALESLAASPETTNISNPTTIVDYAGCPLVNNGTYIPPLAPSKNFTMLCGEEILALKGENLDMVNGTSTEKSFNACLDKCAARQGCVGATWYIYFADDPRRNSMCFLKNGTGSTSAGTGSGWGRQLASGVLKA